MNKLLKLFSLNKRKKLTLNYAHFGKIRGGNGPKGFPLNFTMPSFHLGTGKLSEVTKQFMFIT